MLVSYLPCSIGSRYRGLCFILEHKALVLLSAVGNTSPCIAWVFLQGKLGGLCYLSQKLQVTIIAIQPKNVSHCLELWNDK